MARSAPNGCQSERDPGGDTAPLDAGNLGATYAAGTGREGAAWTSFPCSIAPGGRGRGRHLTARTNFSRLGGGAQQRPGPGERRAQLSPNGEVCKQKRAPTLIPSWASQPQSIWPADSARGRIRV